MTAKKIISDNFDFYRYIQILRHIGILLEIKGESKFKTQAYFNVADMVESEQPDILDYYWNDKLHDLNGFGKALVDKTIEFIERGSISLYDKLSEEIPVSVVELTSIKGLGIKKAASLYFDYGIKSLAELELACREGILDDKKGFGKKFSQTTLELIETKKENKNKIRLGDAIDFAEQFLAKISSASGFEKLSLVGDAAMARPIVEDFSIVICTSNLVNLKNSIKSFYNEYYLEDSDELLFANAKRCKLIFTDKSKFVALKHKLSCSNEYFTAFSDFTETIGWDLVDDIYYQSIINLEFENERELYSKAGLQYVVPELREYSPTLQFAAQGVLPELVNINDLNSILHFHSNWSDGRNTIEEMVTEIRNSGYKFACLTDHSRSAAYAGGLSIERVLEQHHYIDNLNNKLNNFVLLKGIESDILPDGSLDYPDEILEQFDFVVASIHSSMNMSHNEMTERLMKAIDNKYANVIGHPSGSLLLSRKAYDYDLDAIIDKAKVSGTALEINSNPKRLDLSWEQALKAKKAGVKISINPDAHTLSGIQHNKFGIMTARKAWLSKNDIINCYSLEKLKLFVKAKRQI